MVSPVEIILLSSLIAVHNVITVSHTVCSMGPRPLGWSMTHPRNTPLPTCIILSKSKSHLLWPWSQRSRRLDTHKYQTTTIMSC